MLFLPPIKTIPTEPPSIPSKSIYLAALVDAVLQAERIRSNNSEVHAFCIRDSVPTHNRSDI